MRKATTLSVMSHLQLLVIFFVFPPQKHKLKLLCTAQNLDACRNHRCDVPTFSCTQQKAAVVSNKDVLRVWDSRTFKVNKLLACKG